MALPRHALTSRHLARLISRRAAPLSLTPASLITSSPVRLLLLQRRHQSQHGPSSFLHAERVRGPVEPPHTTYFQSPPGADHAYPSPPPPAPTPLPIRVLWTLIRYVAVSTLLLASACYLAFTSLPPATQAALLALYQRRPSDAETLALFHPADASLATINATLLSHPLARALRQNPAFTEARPHLKIPPAARSLNLTAGALAGPGRISVPPLLFAERGGASLVALLHLGDQLCGHPGLVHGGLLATLLDEGLARCCFPALPHRVAVTASLSVQYRRPARAGQYYVLRAVTERVEGRKAWVRGWIEELNVDADEEAVGRILKGGVSDEEMAARKGRVVVEASALFVEPRGAGAMQRLVGTE